MTQESAPLSLPATLIVFTSGMLVICSLAGCGKTEPPLPALHAVKGKVVDGSAGVKGGSLSLQIMDDPLPHVVVAEVDSTGQFELVTIHQGKRIAGVPEGKYRVVYTPATFVFGENVKVVTLSEIHDIRGPQNALTLDLSKSQ